MKGIFTVQQYITDLLSIIWLSGFLLDQREYFTWYFLNQFKFIQIKFLIKPYQINCVNYVYWLHGQAWYYFLNIMSIHLWINWAYSI